MTLRSQLLNMTTRDPLRWRGYRVELSRHDDGGGVYTVRHGYRAVRKFRYARRAVQPKGDLYATYSAALSALVAYLQTLKQADHSAPPRSNGGQKRGALEATIRFLQTDAAKGMTNKAVAQRLQVSTATINAAKRVLRGEQPHGYLRDLGAYLEEAAS